MKILKNASLCILLSLMCLMSLPSIATATGGLLPNEFAIVVVGSGNKSLQTPWEAFGAKQKETTEKSNDECPNNICHGCKVRFGKENPNARDLELVEVTIIPYMSSLPTIVQNINLSIFDSLDEIDITYPDPLDYAIYRVKVRRGSETHTFTSYVNHSSCPREITLDPFKLDTHDDDYDSSINNVSIFPTPCRAHQNVMYSLDKDAYINISVFDMQGRLHKVVSDAYQREGVYALNVDTSSLPPGIYFYKIRMDDTWFDYKFVKME